MGLAEDPDDPSRSYCGECWAWWNSWQKKKSAEQAGQQAEQVQHALEKAKAASAAAAQLSLQRLPLYSRYDRTKSVPLDKDDPRYDLLASRLYSTTVAHRPSKEKPHCSPPEFEVVRIERILNPRLQDKYTSELQDLAGLCEQKCTPLTIDAIPVQSFEGLQLNEFLLFHGLPSNLVQRLALQGLDPRFAGAHFGHLFGHGTYLASNSSKADIYTTTSDEAGVRAMLVVRTCLGEPYYASRACQVCCRPLPPAQQPPGNLMRSPHGVFCAADHHASTGAARQAHPRQLLLPLPPGRRQQRRPGALRLRQPLRQRPRLVTG